MERYYFVSDLNHGLLTKKNMKRLHLLILLATCTLMQGTAQDWPQFLGPYRNSSSPQKGLLRTWPNGNPEVLWSVNIGIGYGGPAVKDGRVYLLDRIDSIGDIMRCFDLTNGQELWHYAYRAPGSFSFPGSRSTPAVSSSHVYSCGPYGHLYCFDIITHQPVWNRNIWSDFGGQEIPIWAITQSPLLYGDLVIVVSQAPEAGMVAYYKSTGKLAWSTPNLGNETYASPSIAKIHGQDHIVMVTSSTNNIARPEAEFVSGNVIGINPHSGNILWKFSGWDCHIAVPSAVDAGDNKLLIAGGYKLGALMLRIEKLDDGSFAPKELFRTVEFGDQTKPPLLANGYFYAQYTTNNRRDGLVCMSMEGEIMWKTLRNPFFNRGSMVLADGLILATDGLTTLFLFEPNPSAFKPIASSELLKQGGVDSSHSMTSFGGSTQNWAPIALADGKLLLRDQNRLLCIRVAE